MKIENIHLKKLTYAALFLSLGLVLPFLTGQIPQIGSMLLPMHIPVLFCGLICGWQYGAAVGFVLPLLRYVLFGMPMMPGALSMAFELASYGLVIGLVYSRLHLRKIVSLYISMITAMLVGRIVWGAVQTVIFSFGEKVFTFKMFLAGAFLNAFPGIVLQLVLIPAVMAALRRAGYEYGSAKKAET